MQPATFAGGVSAANIKTASSVVPIVQPTPAQQTADQEEHDRLMAWLRAQQSSLPKCAEGYTRLAPTPTKR